MSASFDLDLHMIIRIIVAYIAMWLVGAYFLYRHWLNTPPDTWPEKRPGAQRNRARTA